MSYFVQEVKTWMMQPTNYWTTGRANSMPMAMSAAIGPQSPDPAPDYAPAYILHDVSGNHLQLSSLNLAHEGQLGATVSANPGYEHRRSLRYPSNARRHIRAFSFDDTYGTPPPVPLDPPKQFIPNFNSPYGVPQPRPDTCSMPASTNCSNGYNTATNPQEPIYGVSSSSSGSTSDYLYNAQPSPFNYSANSFLGWHRQSMPNRFKPETRQEFAYRSLNQWGINGAANVILEPNGSRIGSSYMLDKQGNSYGYPGQQAFVVPIPMGAASLDSSPVESFTSTAIDRHSTERRKKRRLRLGLVISVLIIMLAVLVAMGVAIYSQVRTSKPNVIWVRQFNGSFLVVAPSPLIDSSELLRVYNKNSVQFKNAASMFKERFDRLFEQTHLHERYKGTDIDALTVIPGPALKVQFILKTDIEEPRTSETELLTILDDAIRQETGIFGDLTIDPNSVYIEGKSFSERNKKRKR